MEATQILQSDVLDLLFEGRNKEYGAYYLRKTYNNRIGLALAITVAVILVLISFPLLAKRENGNKDISTIRDVAIDHFYIKQEVPPIPPKVAILHPAIATKKYTDLIVFKKDNLKDVIPPVEALTAQIGLFNTHGIDETGIPFHNTTGDEKKVIEKPAENEDQTPMKVEIEAAVDQRQWKRYLENKLQPYIESAVADGIAPGQYTVQVRFIVEKDGSINEVQSLTDPGFGLKKAAEDVVKKGPKWTAEEQNGRKVRSYHTQPITFLISDQ